MDVASNFSTIFADFSQVIILIFHTMQKKSSVAFISSALYVGFPLLRILFLHIVQKKGCGDSGFPH